MIDEITKQGFEDFFKDNPEAKIMLQNNDLEQFFERCFLETYKGGWSLRHFPYSLDFFMHNLFEILGFDYIINNIENIPDEMFWGDSIVPETVVIPNNIKSIGRRAFSQTKIKNLYIPKTVDRIGIHAFSNTNITEVYFEDIDSIKFNVPSQNVMRSEIFSTSTEMFSGVSRDYFLDKIAGK